MSSRSRSFGSRQARTGGLGRLGLGEHVLHFHQLLGLDARFVMRALRAVAAILRAAARLDGEERRNLHLARIEMHPMDALRREDQVGQRQIE
jgi:hypothetical protein